jgi:hypothetical protein
MAAVEMRDNETIEQCITQYETIPADLIAQIQIELDAIWENVKATAVMLCPKDTGALAESITLESEGGSGAIEVGGISADGDFYSNSISAGSADVINPKTGEPTDLYALFVHDGHAMPNGMFYSGVPFLVDAVSPKVFLFSFLS